ncbi:uroporphyrinogen-III synthase [Isoptericola sediminis]|uniref:Uroporphyrinogen-III synthase n=1 Tax=Isoptericola sediminis TaxID=2733572 RepID=A0A849KD06_9MICO|nr:uroporphyrinogen-III synthase [Isoptericola sediminis]
MTAPDPRPPLTGRSVLLPRSPERAAGLAALLRDAGADVTVAPVITRAPAHDQEALRGTVAHLHDGRFAWTVITSVNAVEALAGVAARPLAAAPTRWAAVGPATVRALRAVDVEPELVPADASADGLVTAFPHADEEGRPVLLPLGDRARPTLRDGLAARGWHPEVVTAYRTVRTALPADVVGRPYDLVVVTSGSVAREIAAQLGTAAPVVAIGRPSADTAHEVGLTVAGVASAPTDDGLAAAVTTALEQNS